MSRRVVSLFAAKRKSGEPLLEDVLVDELDTENEYRVVASPGLVLGVAAGDVLRVNPESGEFDVLSRGGNICVHFYGDHSVGDSVAEAIRPLGGRMDGRARNLTVLTVPVASGFGELESILNHAAEENTSAEWYYGNVYDPEDGVTPLSWVVSSSESPSE